MPPHSATVRGTLSNPETQEAIQDNHKPPQIGDPVSIHSEKEDSVPLNSVPDFSKPADPYRGNEKEQAASSKDLPHSKKVRGTLANKSGKQVGKDMLGDPVSLKAEPSERGQDRGAKSKL